MEQQENIVADYYDNYTDIQREILQIETRKARNKLFLLATVVFAADLIALYAAGLMETTLILSSAMVPVIFVVLGFVATKEPLLATILAAVIMAGIWIYAIISLGGVAAISGWLIKTIVIVLLLTGIQHGREAHRIRKELRN